MMRRLLSTAALCLAAADVRAQTAPEFAPQLAVDLTAMRAARAGVLVRDIRPGTGMLVTQGATVKVRYRGWVADGTPIDSTTEAEPPVTFVVGKHDVIPGWEDGVVGMQVGGRRQIVVPPKRGYGSKGRPPVPPNATLVFIIDLVAASR